VHVKLPVMSAPSELPSAALLAAAGELFPAAAGSPTGAIRPGCVLLSLDALTAGSAPDAGAAAVALRAAFTAAGCAAKLRGGDVRIGDVQESLVDGSVRSVSATPPLRLWPPAAVLRGADAAVFEMIDGRGAAAARVHARMAGAALRCDVDADDDARAALLLQADAEGAALLEVEHAPGTQADAAAAFAATTLSPPSVVLLCRDAAIVDQICATCSREGRGADADMQRVLLVLGAALRPHAPLRVRCAAAAASVWCGWYAALTRLLAAPDAGAVVLCAATHVAACDASGLSACSAAVADAAKRLWPPAACRAAARLLDTASTRDAHLAPSCAAEAALSHADDTVAPPLRALMALLADAPDDADAAADAAARDNDADELAYLGYMARHNSTHWRVVGALAVLGNALQLLKIVRYLLMANPEVSDVYVSNTRLHPLGGGAAMSPFDVSPGVALPYLRGYVLASLALRLPAQALLIAAVHRTPARWYERTFYTLIMTDICFYGLIEALVMHATGAVAEWPAAPACLHAAGAYIGLRKVPFRLPRVYGMCATKFILTCGPLLWAGAWRVLLHNVGYVTQALVFMSAALLAAGRDRDMRAEHRAAQRLAAAGGAPGGDEKLKRG
jgi:hypothetical protein